MYHRHSTLRLRGSSLRSRRTSSARSSILPHRPRAGSASTWPPERPTTSSDPVRGSNTSMYEPRARITWEGSSSTPAPPGPVRGSPQGCTANRAPSSVLGPTPDSSNRTVATGHHRRYPWPPSPPGRGARVLALLDPRRDDSIGSSSGHRPGGGKGSRTHPVEHSHSEHNDLKDYLRVLRTRKWSILLVTVILVGFALFYSFRQTPLYEAQARVLVQSFSVASTGTLGVDIPTEQQIVASVEVAKKAAEFLGTDRPRQALLGGLKVHGITGTAVLGIAYTNENPVLAANVA